MLALAFDIAILVFLVPIIVMVMYWTLIGAIQILIRWPKKVFITIAVIIGVILLVSSSGA